jgi:act minimal PKS acyl carrier protein
MTTAFTLTRLTEIIEECGDPDSSATVPLDGNDIGNVSFEELGIDSLTLFNTCVEIESIYPVKLSLDDVLAAETPNGLLDLVNQYVGLSA